MKKCQNKVHVRHANNDDELTFGSDLSFPTNCCVSVRFDEQKEHDDGECIETGIDD